MTEVALCEAKNRLPELIARVLNGEVIAITRRGKVVAQLALPTGHAQALRLRIGREPVGMPTLDALAARHGPVPSAPPVWNSRFGAPCPWPPTR